MFITNKKLQAVLSPIQSEMISLRFRLDMSEDRCQKLLDRLCETEKRLESLMCSRASEQTQVTKDTRKSIALLYKHLDLTIDSDPKIVTLEKGSIHGPRIL